MSKLLSLAGAVVLSFLMQGAPSQAQDDPRHSTELSFVELDPDYFAPFDPITFDARFAGTVPEDGTIELWRKGDPGKSSFSSIHGVVKTFIVDGQQQQTLSYVPETEFEGDLWLVFTGNEQVQPATSTAQAVRIYKKSAPISMTADKARAAPGETITFTVDFTYGAKGFPESGTIALYDADDRDRIFSTVAVQAGTTRYYLQTAATDGLRYRAKFSGNAIFKEDRSEILSPAVVAKQDAPVGLSVSDTQIPVGTEVEFTVDIPAAPDGGQIRLVPESGDPLIQLATGLSHYSFRMTPPASGTFSFRAEYTGSDLHNSSVSDARLVTVEKIPLPITLVADALAVTPGSTIAFTATLPDQPDGGEITLHDGNGTSLTRDATQPTHNHADGRASYQIEFKAPDVEGEVEVWARFSGSPRHEDAVSERLRVMVQRLDTPIEVHASATAVPPGTNVTVTALLSSAPTGGTIRLLDGQGKVHDEVEATGLERHDLAFTPLEPGEHQLYVQYSGASQHREAVSEAVLIRAERALTVMSLQAPSTVQAGTPVDVAIRFSAAPAAGNITLRLEDTLVRSFVADGATTVFDATLTLPDAGRFALKAFYAGSLTAAPAETDDIVLEAVPAPGSVMLDVDAVAKAPGDSVDLTATLALAPDAGRITFLLDGQRIGTATADGSSSYHFAHVLDQPGTARFSATFDGNGRIAPASSNEVAVTVEPIAVGLVLAADRTEGAPGDVVRLTLAATPPISQGIVVLSADGAEIARLPMDGSDTYAASYTLPQDASGSVTFAVQLEETARHTATPSPPVSVAVGGIATQLTLAASSSSGTPGARIVVTANLDPAPTTGTLVITLANQIHTIHADGRTSYQIEFVLEDPGQHLLSAHYEGRGRFGASNATPITVTVALAETTVALSAVTSDAVSGDMVDLVAEVAPKAAGGQIRFFDGDTPLATVSVLDGAARYSWHAHAGTSLIRAVYLGDVQHSGATSQPLLLRVKESVAEVFEKKRPEVERLVRLAAEQASRARMDHAEELMNDARNRLRRQRKAAIPNCKGPVREPRAPVTYDGFLKADGNGLRLDGQFGGGGEAGNYCRFIHGRIKLEHAEHYGTTLYVNTSVAYEKSLGPTALAGIWFGGEVASSDVTSQFEGRMTRRGVTAGAYVATILADDVILDGFISTSHMSHEIDLHDEMISINGRYASTAVDLAVTLSGEHAFEGLVFNPELSFTQSSTWTGNITLGGQSGTGQAEATLGESRLHMSRFSFSPRLIRHLDDDQLQTILATPRLACEILRTEQTDQRCGMGIGIGFQAVFAGGRGKFDADIDFDKMEGHARQRLSLDVAMTF